MPADRKASKRRQAAPSHRRVKTSGARAAADRTEPWLGPLREVDVRSPRAREMLMGYSKQDLYQRAKALDIEGRSSMTKDELAEALRERG